MLDLPLCCILSTKLFAHDLDIFSENGDTINLSRVLNFLMALPQCIQVSMEQQLSHLPNMQKVSGSIPDGNIFFLFRDKISQALIHPHLILRPLPPSPPYWTSTPYLVLRPFSVPLHSCDKISLALLDPHKAKAEPHVIIHKTSYKTFTNS